MPHSLIFGQTGSGKTTLAKRLCEGYRRAGICTIVLDPIGDPGWQATKRFHDPDEFLETFWDSRQCAVFIDEAGDVVGRYDQLMIQTATRGRHWGHRVHFISQRGAMLSRTVRDQCEHLFLFSTGRQDCKIHAEEWNKDILMTANQLDKFEYFWAKRFPENAVCKMRVNL